MSQASLPASFSNSSDFPQDPPPPPPVTLHLWCIEFQLPTTQVSCLFVKARKKSPKTPTQILTWLSPPTLMAASIAFLSAAGLALAPPHQHAPDLGAPFSPARPCACCPPPSLSQSPSIPVPMSAGLAAAASQAEVRHAGARGGRCLGVGVLRDFRSA